MTSISDPLTLLREFTIAQRKIELHGEHIVFGETRFERAAPTAYRASGKDRSFYPVNSLWFLLQNADRPHAEYIKECGAQSIKAVSLVDKAKVLSYLKGDSETSASIDIEHAPVVQSVREVDLSKAADEASKALLPEEEEELEASRAQAAEQTKLLEAQVLSAKQVFARVMDEPLGVASSAGGEGEADGEATQDMREQADKPMVAARPFIKADFSATKLILKRERKLRTRKTVLLASAASSFPALTQVLETFRKKNEGTLLKETAAKASGGHSRSSAGASHQRQKPPSANKPSAAAATLRPLPASKQASSSRPGSIIIVPSVVTSLVSLWNAQQLLQNKTFIAPIEVKQSGESKPSSVRLTHTFEDGAQGFFTIIDNPSKLTARDWERVVCVFVQGNAWQFKGWPFESPVDLFTKILGVNVRFSDEQPNQLVKGWTVKSLVLSKQKTKQHEIGVTTMIFWQALHKHMACHKPHLLQRSSQHH